MLESGDNTEILKRSDQRLKCKWLYFCKQQNMIRAFIKKRAALGEHRLRKAVIEKGIETVCFKSAT